MVFSSYGFLFVFMPAFFLIYFLIGSRYRNFVILAGSLIFYALGERWRIAILLVSMGVNFLLGLRIRRGLAVSQHAARRWLVAGVVFNLALLACFKYLGFLEENANEVLRLFGGHDLLPMAGIVLPLGISFFAFQGISYLVDIYRGTIRGTTNLLTFAAYKSMFPQLVAGPIVRYADVAAELADPKADTDAVFAGIGRFIRGLAKKVLIADTLSVTADAIFALSPRELSLETAWLGVAAYTLQIYFDFSGYSDMAIGMGRMMGFKYPENFNHPYVSRSIGEFWRRWHMTLSAWFRDYLYLPLGGNRRGRGRTYLNLVIVFALTGLWHGASWTFVVWGLWHGLFMLVERRFDPGGWPVPGFVRHIYTMLVVMVGWALFRAESAAAAAGMLKAMFGFGPGGAFVWPVATFIDPLVAGALVAGLVFSMPVRAQVAANLPAAWWMPASLAVAGLLLSACGLKVLSGAYSPFLYFRF
ncbi:MBOAT family O-acyltransferase [Labrys monachus]|uniref:Probable alginate O-acetylase AlgI n=1 Tax=Labrys monachus TaxID=217067 RepID=A0ABU0FDI9_9HYPH|nr:MBOAT family O-acyltransferase [Labrys monachus]MDQ0392668.1 alginate O-acetyltransferase complex protein AlgI [Labrys monachus]